MLFLTFEEWIPGLYYYDTTVLVTDRSNMVYIELDQVLYFRFPNLFVLITFKCGNESLNQLLHWEQNYLFYDKCPSFHQRTRTANESVYFNRMIECIHSCMSHNILKITLLF